MVKQRSPRVGPAERSSGCHTPFKGIAVRISFPIILLVVVSFISAFLSTYRYYKYPTYILLKNDNNRSNKSVLLLQYYYTRTQGHYLIFTPRRRRSKHKVPINMSEEIITPMVKQQSPRVGPAERSSGCHTPFKGIAVRISLPIILLVVVSFILAFLSTYRYYKYPTYILLKNNNVRGNTSVLLLQYYYTRTQGHYLIFTPRRRSKHKVSINMSEGPPAKKKKKLTAAEICRLDEKEEGTSTLSKIAPTPGEKSDTDNIRPDYINSVIKTSVLDKCPIGHNNMSAIVLTRSSRDGEGIKTDSIVESTSRYRMAARIHDMLGWDNFMEGRIAVIWVKHRSDDIRERKLKRGDCKWAKMLMIKLLQITHQQWMYWNATVHKKIKDGCTENQHHQALDEIEKYLETDPEELLREHKHLLFTNFKNLAEGPIKDKRQWIAEIKAARSAAYHVGKGSSVALRTRYSRTRYPWLQHLIETVQVDTEGSLRWRRRKRC